ncbi:UNVERIFIED_CONTAM: hypothetical protein K2H54_041118 [Gekko kuhli]
MRSAGHVRVAYARWGRVQMADAEADAALAPEMQRLSAGLRSRLWQLQAELSDQEVSEASSGAYCRGFCQYGIWVTRVFKDNMCTSLRPKTLILEKSKGKLDASPPNKKQGLRSVPEPSSLECNKRREIKPGTTPKLSPCNNKHTEMGTQDGLEKTYALPVSHDSNSHIRPQDEYLVAEVPHRQKPINCQKWVTHEMDLDLRSHQVVTMSLGAPTNAKSLALELWEAEVEQARAQQSQSIFMDGMSKEAEGSLILPTSSANWEQLPHSMDKRRPEILVQQGAEGDPLVPPHQGGMLDNSIEDVLFTMFEDLTPQEQQVVTERLEHTKNCLLARKVPDLSEQQAIRGDATVNSNSHPSMQVPLAPQSFPPIDVEMATEQSGTGTSAAITDSPQMPKNGSVFFDRDRSLNHITEFD